MQVAVPGSYFEGLVSKMVRFRHLGQGKRIIVRLGALWFLIPWLNPGSLSNVNNKLHIHGFHHMNLTTVLWCKAWRQIFRIGHILVRVPSLLLISSIALWANPSHS